MKDRKLFDIFALSSLLSLRNSLVKNLDFNSSKTASSSARSRRLKCAGCNSYTASLRMLHLDKDANDYCLRYAGKLINDAFTKGV